MSDVALVTQAEIVVLDEKVNQVLHSLETHVQQTHGQTHIGLAVSTPSPLYKDSAGQTWGNRVCAVMIDGVVYYVPATII